MEEISEAPVVETKTKTPTAVWLKSEAAIRAADLVAGAVAITIVFWWLQYSTAAICCGDYDGYYHIKWAQLLWQNLRAGHFPPAFPWLPLTTLNPRNYVDHHLLYHLILIPFTWFRDMQTGAKVSAILFASLAVFACYWLVVRYEIRYRLIWLLFILAVIWTIVIGWTEEKFEWRPMVFVLGGIALGLVINPYFPHNLYLIYEHARMKITANGFATKVGQEWYPYDTAEFVVNCYVALAAMLV